MQEVDNDIHARFGEAYGMEEPAQVVMPKYKCHKEVWALKIREIHRDQEDACVEGRETDGHAIITPEEPGYAPFRVDAEYMRKHKPVVGGYYVVYVDGYKSFSPAKAFDEGYAKV